MHVLIQYSFLFMFGAFCGWLLEVGYRSMKNKKLTNPGFLNGPYLSIYGFGIIILHTFCNIQYPFTTSKWQNVLIYTITTTVLLTLIEFVVGLIFINGLKMKLWDYSKRWGNIKGIICPALTLIWSILGLGYYFLINPWLLNAIVIISQKQIMILLMGIIYGIFLVDLYNVMQISSRIRKIAIKFKIIINYEELKRNATAEWKKMSIFRPFKLSNLSKKNKNSVMKSKTALSAIIKKRKSD